MDIETYAKQILMILQSKTGYIGTTIPDWKNVYNVPAFRPKFLVRPLETNIGNTHIIQSRFFEVVLLEETEEGRQDMEKAFLKAQSDNPNGYKPIVDTIDNYAFLKRKSEIAPLMFDDLLDTYHTKNYSFLPLGRHYSGVAIDNDHYTYARFYLQYPITSTTTDLSAASLFITPSAAYVSSFTFHLEPTEYALSSERMPAGNSIPAWGDEYAIQDIAITAFVKNTQQELNVLTAIQAYQGVAEFDKYVLPYKFFSNVALDNASTDAYESLPQIHRKPHRHFKDRSVEPYFKLTTKVPDGFPYWINSVLREEKFPNGEMVTIIEIESRWVL